MNTTRTLSLLLGTALLALALVAGPALALDLDEAGGDVDVLAVEEGDEAEPAPATDDGERRALADSPRSRVGLLLYGALIAMAAFGFVGMRKQLAGRNPQATGEFRWR
jgi:hypothetical protein